VAGGLDLMGQPDSDRAFALAMVGVGIGSVALHGPGGVLGKWAHDASLLSMLGLLALADLTVAEGRHKPRGAVAGIVVASMLGALPSATDISQAVAGALAASAETRRFLRKRAAREAGVTVPLWVLGGSLHVLGRTGQPLCREDSLLQAHAGWHVVSAAALWSRRHF